MIGHQRTVAVIGLGTLGVALSRELLRMGDRVVGIDVSEDRVSEVCEELTSTAVADAGSRKAMVELGLDVFDAVVIAISQSIEASVLAATHALELGCKNVWARAENDTHRIILERIGVHNVIVPQRKEGERLAQRLHNPALVSFIDVGDDHLMAHVLAPKRLRESSAPTKEIKRYADVTLIGVLRGGNVLQLQQQELELHGGDVLIVFGPRAAIRAFTDHCSE